MTVEAGDCNGKSEGSKKVELELEVKQGGDLKENGNACRDREGEEIGGSFVIVNGDSDDQSSDKDDPKSDPTVENGEMVLEKGEGGSEEKEVRSNCDVEVGGGDHEKIVGSRSDADVAEMEEVDVEVETAKVEETEKLDVEIEEGEVEEMVVEVKEKGEELEVVEEDREGRVAASENVNEGNLGCRVEKVTAAKELESEPASQVNNEAELVASENGSDSDLGSAIKEGDKMEIVVVESGRVEMLKPVSQVNEAPEPETVVVELGRVEMLEPVSQVNEAPEPETVVVELGRVEVLEPVSHVSEEPEPETVVVESASEEELELVSQVNEEPEPETVVVESGSVEVLEPISQVNEEPEPVVSKNGSRGDLGHAIEGEDAAGSVVVESDSLEGFKPVSQVNEEPEPEPEPVVSENGRVADLESTIKEEDIKESVVVVSDSLEGSEPASRVNEEAEPVVLNKGTRGDLESEDVTETVVVEWGSLEGSEPASQVNEALQPFVSSNRSKGDLESTIEEEDTTETVVVESDSLEGFEPISQVNEGAEPVVSENGSKGDLESTVEEVDATETVVVGSDSLKGLEPASLVSEGPHPESIIETTEEKGDIEVGEVEESSKHGDVAEEIANVAEGQVDVKVELKDETENVDEEVEKVENVDEEVEKVESAEIEEPKAEIEEPKAEVEETYNRAELDSAERQIEITTEVDEVKVLEAVIKETDNQEEVGSAETNTIGANEEKVSEPAIDETGNQEAVGPAATNTIELSIEKVPEAIIEETDNQVEAEGRVEPDTEKIENAEAKDVSDNMDSTAELSAVSLKDELNGEDINIPPESSETAHVDCVAEEDLVEGISHSTDVKHVEVEVSSRETVELDPKSDIAIQDDEPRLQTQEFVEDFSHSTDDEYVAVGVSNREIVGLEPKTDISIEVNEPMLETQEPIEDVETNKDVNIEKMKLESNSGNESAVDSECVVSFIVGEQATSKDDDEGANNEQAEVVELQTLPETHVVKLHQIFLAKVPRFIDHELQQKIEDARLVVDEKTKIRDSIGEKAKKQAAIANERMSEYREALFKEKAARAEFNIKRKEIEKEQVLIQSINNASSIADIDEKVRNMNHRQQHETLSLKEEKQYIHEINQMKKVRDQLLSKKAPQDQIDMVLRQKDEIEARVKNLKKELDSCRAALSSTENNTKSAWNRHMEEDKLLRKLKEEHNAADGVRQEAYLHAIKLRNQFNEKAKHFKMYKADQSAATNYIFSGDNQGLRLHCSKQVEKVMDLWNNNRDFREQYVNSNTYSTVRRLGTLDGRSLGPDEEPPILHSTANRSSNITLGPSSNVETPVPVSVPEARKGNPAETSVKVERTNQFPKLKSSTKPVVSNSAESKEEERLNKLKKEEEDLARKQEDLARKEEELRIAKLAKEEELRKEKAAAELKEQLRLEQKAKAREAEERKRRKSEKAQAKAEYRAQKEAELREKKKTKKGNKKTGIADSTSNRGTEGKNTPALEINPLETSQEPETSSSTSSRKRSSMPVSVMKQYNKVQTPVPLPLRNKSKRKMTTWMWALLVTLLVVALFIAGNYVSFSTSGMHDFGF